MQGLNQKLSYRSALIASVLLTSTVSFSLLFADDAVMEETDAQPSACCSLPSTEYPPHLYQIRMRHLEGTGVGFNKGYSSLDTFIPFFNHSDTCVPFIDARGHIFNDGKWAANGGLGLRFLPSEQKWIYGVNAFYDFRQTNHSNFNQIGAGLELLGSIVEFRLNGYFPVGDTKHRYKDKFDGFKNHYAYFLQKYDFPFIGGDFEIGSKIYRGNYFSLDATLAGYYFSGKYNEQAGGGLANLKANITPYLTLSGTISYDSLFKCRGNGELSLNIPFGGRKKLKQAYLSPKQKLYLEERFLEPVGRFEIIVADTHTRKSKALDPVTGDPLFFVFVDNLRGSSDGSIENPYRTLAQAQANSSPGQVIYVFSGDGTTTGMDTGITLQNNQYFIGSASNFNVDSKFGRQTIPAQTSTAPSVENPGVPIVNLANNNTIQGFQFLSGTFAVNAQNRTNGVITQNYFSPLVNPIGINLTETSGTFVITQNHFETASFGVRDDSFTTTKSLIITENNFVNEPIHVLLSTTSASTISFLAARNNFANSSQYGIVIEPGGTITGTIEENNFQNIAINAIFDTNHTGIGIVDILHNQIGFVGTGINLEVGNNGQGYWNIQNNIITNATTNAVLLENDGNANTATYVKFVHNAAFANGVQGYVLQNVAGTERFFIVGNSLYDVASNNIGSIVGPDTPPNKVGPFTVPLAGVTYFPTELINP